MNTILSGSSQMKTITSTSLLERVRALDDDAWKRFVAIYGPMIYDWCRSFGVQPADANDIGKEVLNSVLRNLGEFKKVKPGDSFHGWLHVIVRNKVRDHYRRLKSHPTGVGGSEVKMLLDQIPDEISQSSVGAEPDGNVALKRALDLIRAEFQEQTWLAFWRLTVEGHRASEIAQDLGMTPNNVRQAKFRVLQRLKSEFGELFSPSE